MTKRNTTGWAIKSGEGRIYVGWHLSRKGMIAQHVHDLRMPNEPEISAYAWSSGLNDAQKAIWKRLKSHGDRCVKVHIRDA